MDLSYIGNTTSQTNISIPFGKIKKTNADAKKAPRTITYTLALVRQVFNYAKNHNLYYGDNPVNKVKKPSEDNRIVRFLSQEETPLLLGKLYQIRHMLQDIYLLYLQCGLRAGEMLNLIWNDIDFLNRTILIKDTKSGRNRNAIMTHSIEAMLKNRHTDQNNGIVFPSRKGEKTTEVSRTFDRVVEKLGFNKGITDRRQKLVFHSLRHTYASWLVMSGVDLYTVQKLMGHSTISMTERYSHLAPDHLKKAVSMLEKTLADSKVVQLDDLRKGA